MLDTDALYFIYYSHMNQEPTNTELLKAITEGQKHTDGRIDEILEVVNDFSTKMDKRFDKVEADVGTLKSDVGTLKSDVSTLKSNVGYLKSNMVDKDYLDRALANQKGEIVFIINKEDAKVRKLTSLLSEKKVLTPTEAQNIMSMEPFPRMNI